MMVFNRIGKRNEAIELLEQGPGVGRNLPPANRDRPPDSPAPPAARPEVTLQKLLVATDAAEASPLTVDHAVQLAQLGASLNALGEKLKGPRRVCQAKVRVGIPYEEILDEAEQMAADLILLGHKAAPGLGRFLLGSTAERVVRHASCSVFVARRRPVNGP